MEKRNILKWIILALAIAVDVFILINAFMDGETSAKESGTIAHQIADVINDIKPETITPQNFDQFHFDIRKAIGHFGLFGVSGVFSTWSLYLFLKDTKLKFVVWFSLISLGAGVALAGVSELAQMATVGRGPAMLDVGIDSLGYFSGVLLVILILLLAKKPVFSRKDTPQKITENKEN